MILEQWLFTFLYTHVENSYLMIVQATYAAAASYSAAARAAYGVAAAQPATVAGFVQG